jgi:hypothetical protein
MRNLKRSKFFSLGRKWVFTLALFLFVFAAASAVKIQAAGNMTGWLWGGGAESDGSAPYDETSTNVGWISANSDNQGGSVDYGINVPSGTGDISGYAWSENIGWISFNAADLAGCPQGSCKSEKVAGNNLKGWARILSIKTAFATGNSGGWQGWISLSGPQYGVKINADNTLSGFAWSDELGWIDFSKASYKETSLLEVKPDPLTLQSGNNPGSLFATVSSSSGPVDGKKINFTILPGGSSKISLVSSTCTTGATGSGECSVSTKAADLLTDETAQVQAQCADSSCNATITRINIKRTLSCTISCPSDFQVTAGDTADYNVNVSGESGCALSSCNETSDPKNIIDSVNTLGTGCEITASSATRFGTGEVTARTNGGQTCPTEVNIKGPGWIETNP